jgi:hypothetical protein
MYCTSTQVAQGIWTSPRLPSSIASRVDTALAYIATIEPYLTTAKACITAARKYVNTVISFLSAAKSFNLKASCWNSDQL